MKNKKNIIIVLIIVFILTGCTAKANINVNYNGSVDEEVHVLSNNNYFPSDIKRSVENYLNEYKDILDFKKYKYEYEKGKKISGAKVYKTYDNICDYFGNSAFNQYAYKYMECTEDEDYYIIKNATDFITYCSNCGEWPSIEKIEYKLKLKFPATENNADSVKNNTYIWKYDKDTNSKKSFYLKTSKKLINETQQQYINDKKESKRNKIILLVLIITVLIIVGGVFLLKKYKKNKLDY